MLGVNFYYNYPVTDKVKRLGILLTVTFLEIGKRHKGDMAKLVADEIFCKDPEETKTFLDFDITDDEQLRRYARGVMEVIKLRPKTEDSAEMCAVIKELVRRTEGKSFNKLEDYLGHLCYLLQKDDYYRDFGLLLSELYCRYRDNGLLLNLFWDQQQQLRFQRS